MGAPWRLYCIRTSVQTGKAYSPASCLRRRLKRERVVASPSRRLAPRPPSPIAVVFSLRPDSPFSDGWPANTIPHSFPSRPPVHSPPFSSLFRPSALRRAEAQQQHHISTHRSVAASRTARRLSLASTPFHHLRCFQARARRSLIAPPTSPFFHQPASPFGDFGPPPPPR